MTIFQRPQFAVVGHPNKGKSSIVSTLCQNDSVVISSQSGTTKNSTHYRVELASAGFELIDTPGFQRPVKALAWLNQRASSAAERTEAVRQFVLDPDCQQNFPDEVALLKPLVDGAAILYVVDGSRPYGREYEAEMEILRWTGRPSMALINPIENERYVTQWQQALTQYFKTVSVFNPMNADFEKQVSLLETFAFLSHDWHQSIKSIVAELRQRRQQQKYQSAQLLARLLEDVCFHRCSQKVLTESQAELIRPALEKQYCDWLVQRERDAMQALANIYAFSNAQLELEQLSLPPDLFDQKAWFVWGLNKKQLAMTAAIAGATAGATIDLAVGGSSFMLGAVGGGLAGLGSALWGADRLLKLKLKGLPLGGFEAIVGPIAHTNFPYVVAGRFIFLYQQLSNKNHANRSAIRASSSELQNRMDALANPTKKRFQTALSELTRQRIVPDLDQILIELL